MAQVLEPGAENSTHTCMEGTNGVGGGSGGNCADISEQVVWGVGPRVGSFLPSAGPIQHDRKLCVTPMLWL